MNKPERPLAHQEFSDIPSIVKIVVIRIGFMKGNSLIYETFIL